MQSKKKRVGKYIVNLSIQLGSGTYSKVYKGIDQTTNQQVAVKISNRQQIQEDQYTKNAFYSEIQIMKQLKSKNVVRFLDVHQTKHNYYIIQQLADGGTLRKLMNQAENKRFDQQTALSFFVQLLNGFGQLVKNGIIHRDIKPENILIKDNILKIADFGFAKQSDNNSYMKTILGTPLYMSPQLLKSEDYSYKCDIWALGVMLYQMIVGQSPWPLKHKNMLLNIENHQIQFPPNIKIHDKVKSFILGCLKYKQQDRYDWQQIYLHPLFIKSFQNNFIGDNQHCIKLAFIVSQIRMSIHSQNLQVTKIIDKLPPQMNQTDFQSLFKLINPNLTSSQVNLIYKNCQQKFHINGLISRQIFSQYMKSIGIRMKAINLAQMRKQSTDIQNQSATFLLIAGLKHRIDQNKIDLYQIYRFQDKEKTNALGLNQFSGLVLKIDQNLKQNQIQALFKQFDLNKDGKISFNQFYRTMCKIAGVMKLQQSKIPTK